MASDDEPRTAIGTADERTDADLDRLAEVSDADLEDAAAFWRERVPEKWAGLVDAEPHAAD